MHGGNYLDPVCRDIEAYLASSQSRVTGEASIALRPGRSFVNGVTSEHTLMGASRSNYGETTQEWSARDAAGFCKILSVPATLYNLANSSPKELVD